MSNENSITKITHAHCLNHKRTPPASTHTPRLPVSDYLQGRRHRRTHVYRNMDQLPAGVLASLRSMSVSDPESGSPHAPTSTQTVPNVPKLKADHSDSVSSLKKLKAAKRAAKRARDAAPDDARVLERYAKAKKRYKDMKKRLEQAQQRSPRAFFGDKQQPALQVSPLGLAGVTLQQAQHLQARQDAQHLQQRQEAQQHCFAEMSPRVAAAAKASSRRRESLERRMSVLSSVPPSDSVGHVGSVAGAHGLQPEHVRSPAAKRRVRFADEVELLGTQSPGGPSEHVVGPNSGKSSMRPSSGSVGLSSGNVSENGSEKAASQNSSLVKPPIPERRRRANSGKKSKFQEHIDYASGPQFHPEWHARREEWMTNYSNAGTIRKYRPYANKFIQFLEQHGQAMQHPGTAITRTMVNQFQQHVKANETPSNQTMILSAVSSFLKHLAEEDVTSKDRSKTIKIPAAPKPKKKKDLTIDQVKQIMNAADNAKAKALLAAAYFAGLRTKETVYLTADNCRVVDGNMTIRVSKESAKGKKMRDVPIAKLGANLLKPFIRAAQIRGGKQYLFPGRFPDTHIVEKTMWNYIKKPARSVGLEEVASHHFRHAFASHGAQSGVDIATIKDQMGHASLKTTSKYCHGKKDHESSVSASLNTIFGSAQEDANPKPVVKESVPKAQENAHAMAQELIQLANMYREGLITKQEFINAKAKLSLLK